MYPELLRFLDCQDLEGFQCALLEGADPDTPDYWGAPPLLQCADRVWLEPMAMLLSRGADPDRVNDDTSGDTALHRLARTSPSACDTRQTKVTISPVDAAIELLLKHGADVNKINISGFSPLDEAYKAGNGVLVRLLQRAGARLVALAGTPGSELSLAVMTGDTEALATLLDQGIDVDARDCLGDSALHAAARSGNAGMVRYLLSRGANLQIRGDAEDQEGVPYPGQGDMPLHVAARAGHTEIVRLLLEAGADANVPGSIPQGDSPLVCAAYAAQARETMELLLRYGADIHARRPPFTDSPGGISSGNWYSTPLAVTAWLNAQESVVFLLEQGAGERREELLEAIRSACLMNGYNNLPLLWEAGQRLAPPLHLQEVLPYLDEIGVDFIGRRIRTERESFCGE